MKTPDQEALVGVKAFRLFGGEGYGPLELLFLSQFRDYFLPKTFGHQTNND